MKTYAYIRITTYSLNADKYQIFQFQNLSTSSI